jgi:hypothetical protein
MNKYEVTVEDVYDKNKTKKFIMGGHNVYEAHKSALTSVNAIREEISKMTKNGRTVFTFRNGFSEE